jgi:hypothetical protein
MKRTLLALAAITLFLATAALPSFADGNPTPPGSQTVCAPFGGCTPA